MAQASRHSAPERERKFLVKKLPANLSKFKHQQIEQGYLAIPKSNGGSNEIRIRHVGGEYVLTVKRDRGEHAMRRKCRFPPQAPAASGRSRLVRGCARVAI